ncbi:uncharacterized protein [Choristoneura fumiferana]|uniref:uncharacterized protein n=1 Tax=Choristoneura fumiferana TaxID=7141 RepID=UPI003D158E3B
MDIILEVEPTVGWDLCPAEILIIIFEKLDITSLRCCSLVNRRWKEIVYDICEFKELWKEFAEDGVANCAVMHRSKSLLSWKDLYFNSLLWNNIKSTTINKINEIEKLIIKSIFVYKDNIIIVSSTNVEYYNVESFQLVGAISVTCDCVEETDDMIVVGSKNNDYYRITLFGKLDNSNNLKSIEKHFLGETYHDACEVSRSWRWKLHNNACYLIDFKSILWRAYRLDNTWHVKSLARYFGVYQDAIENSISVMHIYKQQDVFVSFKFGDLMRVDRNAIEFRRVHRPEVPTHVITGPIIDRKPYKKGLDKFNAFLSAPFGVGFDAEFTEHDLVHFYYDDPTLSCGMQHGEVVFLGYDDGRVAIILLKNYTEPVRIINIKDFEKYALLDPAVTGLDVCEVKNKHMLFVKTNSKMYQLLIEYPDNLIREQTELWG